MKILLPQEVALLRRVESSVIDVLNKSGFEEIMLPRLLRERDWIDVVRCLGQVSEELETQTFRLTSKRGVRHVLCHWQCEPFYLAMRTQGENLPNRVFDRSGWSFRDESNTRGLHFQQFQRMEAIWFGHSQEIRSVGLSLMIQLREVFSNMGIVTEVRPRPLEVEATTQVEVRDLVFQGRRGEIELVGMHFHGNSFVKHFLKPSHVDFESGCLGISLSRIATLLLHKPS